MVIDILRDVVREVAEFVNVSKYSYDYIQYDLSSNSDSKLGWISRHNPGGIDEGGEYDVWTINLDNLEHDCYDYSPDDQTKKEVEGVVELLRNSPNYANFMRLTQSA